MCLSFSIKLIIGKSLKTTATPKISVIIPVYNAQDCLKACLDSVAAQTMTDFEGICVDDGSTDASPDILQDYLEKDSRFHCFRQENAGAGAARNIGIQQARGEYIHFLDADDLLDADAYQIALAAVSDADLCMFLFREMETGSGRITAYPNFPVLTDKTTRRVKTTVENSPELILRTSVVPWNKIYRRDFIQRNGLKFEKLYCSEDRLFFFQCTLLAKFIVLFNRPLITHRVEQKDSLSSKNGMENLNANLEANDQIIEFASNQSEPIRSIIQDITHNEAVLCYWKTTRKDRPAAALRLKEAFLTMDHSLIEKQMVHAPWYQTYRMIIDIPANGSLSYDLLRDSPPSTRAGRGIRTIRDNGLCGLVEKLKYFCYARQYQWLPRLFLQIANLTRKNRQ